MFCAAARMGCGGGEKEEGGEGRGGRERIRVSDQRPMQKSERAEIESESREGAS